MLIYGHGNHRPRELVSRREYVASVTAVSLCATHAAVFFGGECRALVHPIEPPPGVESGDVALPPASAGAQPAPLTCVALTRHFAITGASNGALCHYALGQNLAQVNQHR